MNKWMDSIPELSWCGILIFLGGPILGTYVELINGLSYKESNCIDPFLGSGTTLIACEKTKRKCYGMELDPHYCDVIVKRWENFTGKKATLDGYKEEISRQTQEV